MPDRNDEVRLVTLTKFECLVRSRTQDSNSWVTPPTTSSSASSSLFSKVSGLGFSFRLEEHKTRIPGQNLLWWRRHWFCAYFWFEISGQGFAESAPWKIERGFLAKRLETNIIATSAWVSTRTTATAWRHGQIISEALEICSEHFQSFKILGIHIRWGVMWKRIGKIVQITDICKK